MGGQSLALLGEGQAEPKNKGQKIRQNRKTGSREITCNNHINIHIHKNRNAIPAHEAMRAIVAGEKGRMAQCQGTALIPTFTYTTILRQKKPSRGSEIRQRAEILEIEHGVGMWVGSKYSNRENTQRDMSRISGRWEPRTRSTGSGWERRGGHRITHRPVSRTDRFFYEVV